MPARDIFAVQSAVYEDLFEDPIGQLLLENSRLRLIVLILKRRRFSDGYRRVMPQNSS